MYEYKKWFSLASRLVMVPLMLYAEQLGLLAIFFDFPVPTNLWQDSS